jgi:glycosyltransferase involved in cell wall biosynthesis
MLYYKRKYEIEIGLEALCNQRFNKEQFELIVIDDGSPDDISPIIEKAKKQINLEYIRLEHTGNLSINRNTGVAKAKGEFLIFLDSEMITEPDFLQSFYETIGDQEKIVVLGGYRSILPFERNILRLGNVQNNLQIIRNLPAMVDDRVESMVLKKEQGIAYIGNWQVVYGNCICVSKKEFLSVGGFDNAFANGWGAEDIETGYRLFKNGNRIVHHERVVCYHLPHPADRHACITSLKRNYQYFIRKHNHWLVELFIREFEAHAVETITLQEKILKRQWCIHNAFSLNDGIWKSYEKVVLFGIEDTRILDGNNIKAAYIPESKSNSPKIRNLIGITIDENDNSYDCAIISGEYETINRGLFMLIVNEAKRVADTVIILYADGRTIFINRDEHRRRVNDFILFTMSFKSLNEYTSYSYLNLAVSLDKSGFKVGLQADNDTLNDAEFNNGYLMSKDPSFNKAIKRLRSHDFNIIGDQIPCIMDRYCSNFSERSFDTRIMWEEQKLLFEENSIQSTALNQYSKVLVKREWEKNVFSHKNGIDYLPMGIDSRRINAVRNSNKSLQEKKQFKFVWSDIATDTCSNLPVILHAFTECFGNNPKIILKVVTAGNNAITTKCNWYSDNLQILLRNSSLYQKITSDYMLSSCINEYSSYGNVQFVNNVSNIESYSEIIAQSNCLISLNGGLEISPLVLEAIGLGVPVMTYDTNVYKGYMEYGSHIPVSCYQVSACHLEKAVIRSPYLNLEPVHSFLFNTPDKNSLCGAMNRVVKCRDEFFSAEYRRKEFVELFDWEQIAKRFIRIIFQ